MHLLLCFASKSLVMDVELRNPKVTRYDLNMLGGRWFKG